MYWYRKRDTQRERERKRDIYESDFLIVYLGDSNRSLPVKNLNGRERYRDTESESPCLKKEKRKEKENVCERES